MPRRQPGAVRAQKATARDVRSSRIDGLSVRATAALAVVESQRLWPGRISSALREYRRFLRRPGRWLYLPMYDFPVSDDPIEARDHLQVALDALHPRSRAELLRIVAPLDEEMLRRTLPDPLWGRSWGPYGDRWWHHRLEERP